MRRRFPPAFLSTLVQTPDPRSVTTIAEHEVHPRAAGLDDDAIDAIWGAVEHLYDSGLHPAIAFCLRRRGHIVLDRAIGHARGNGPDDGADAERVPATPDTLFNIFSASKAVTAMLIHHIDDRGLLHIDDRVADYIPEFARHGKERVTIRHVLSHRSGIPTLPVDPDELDLDILARPDEIVDLLCESEPTFVAGRRLAYHAITGGFILGEIVRRVTGRSIREVLAKDVLEPLGTEHMNYGVDASLIPQCAESVYTGPPLIPPASTLARRILGADYEKIIEFSNDPRFYTATIPAGNIIGTAEEVCRFFQVLLDGGVHEGSRIFQARTIRRARQEDSWLEADLTMGIPVRYGLGFVLGTRHLSLYGRNSPDAFGHLGLTNVLAWADPARDIAACLMTSGKPLFSPRVLRFYKLTRVIARHTRR